MVPWGFAIGYGVAALLLGSVPFALLLGRLRGIDIRKVGSGNVGATNLARSAGLGWGVLAFVLDAGKGFLPVWALLAGWVAIDVSSLWLDGAWYPAAVGCAAVLGHCFSPFLNLRGGKGVATTVGAVAALDPVVTGGLLLVWVATLALLRNVGVASSVAATAGVGVGAFFLAIDDRRVLGSILILLGGVILVRHRRNIRDFLGRRMEANR
ncbi:MAG: glycerol-3-phosphate acyltransferase [Planctomycetota bacterium]